jgi:uracil-DNA glycosylase
MNPSQSVHTTTSCFNRLNTWVEDLEIEEFFFVNASPKTGKVTKKDLDLDNLLRACYNARIVIALGNYASDALNSIGVTHFKLPHPSGLNRQLNDKDFVENQLMMCRRYINRYK